MESLRGPHPRLRSRRRIPVGCNRRSSSRRRRRPAADGGVRCRTRRSRGNRQPQRRCCARRLRFSRVFQLSAPEAPGLVFLGAEADPGMIAPGHAQAPLPRRGRHGPVDARRLRVVHRRGRRASLAIRGGRRGARREQRRGDAGRCEGRGVAFSRACCRGPANDARFDCLMATGLTSDPRMLVPAEICLRRVPAARG